VAELYEIVNPSDAYTVEGEREAVCVAALLLGEGAYGVSGENGTTVMPILCFGGEAALEAWWEKAFGHPFKEAPCGATVAAALESVMIGSRADRARMERVLAAIASPEDRERAKAAWHDERRSSLNDIGRRAVALSKAIRARSAA
jgi:hypothetical protein